MIFCLGVFVGSVFICISICDCIFWDVNIGGFMFRIGGSLFILFFCGDGWLGFLIEVFYVLFWIIDDFDNFEVDVDYL